MTHNHSKWSSSHERLLARGPDHHSGAASVPGIGAAPHESNLSSSRPPSFVYPALAMWSLGARTAPRRGENEKGGLTLGDVAPSELGVNGLSIAPEGRCKGGPLGQGPGRLDGLQPSTATEPAPSKRRNRESSRCSLVTQLIPGAIAQPPSQWDRYAKVLDALVPAQDMRRTVRHTHHGGGRRT